MTSVMQLPVTAAACMVAASAISFTAWTWREKRNADLVRIGISVLRVDPQKEKDLSDATRKWALDLIDANAGGVKFSKESRAQLLKEPLESKANFASDWHYANNWGFDSAPHTSTSPSGVPSQPQAAPKP